MYAGLNAFWSVKDLSVFFHRRDYIECIFNYESENSAEEKKQHDTDFKELTTNDMKSERN